MKLPDMFHNETFNIKHLSPYNDVLAGGVLLITIYNLLSKNMQEGDAILFIKYLYK